MQVSLVSKGDWNTTKRYLRKLSKQDYMKVLDACGKQGVEALASATPKDSGKTAASWNYNIVKSGNEITIEWTNDNFGNGWFPIAIMLQYGHGTGTGGYVQGYDYINPAIRPVFEKISETVWRVIRES